MNILLQIDDAQLFDLSKMPNIPTLLDKSYKKMRSQMITELAHERQVFIAFDAWFMTMNPAEREHLLKSLRSSIDLEEIVPKEIRGRELIMEAARRYRENMAADNSETEASNAEVEEQ